MADDPLESVENVLQAYHACNEDASPSDAADFLKAVRRPLSSLGVEYVTGVMSCVQRHSDGSYDGESFNNDVASLLDALDGKKSTCALPSVEALDKVMTVLVDIQGEELTLEDLCSVTADVLSVPVSQVKEPLAFVEGESPLLDFMREYRNCFEDDSLEEIMDAARNTYSALKKYGLDDSYGLVLIQQVFNASDSVDGVENFSGDVMRVLDGVGEIQDSLTKTPSLKHVLGVVKTVHDMDETLSSEDLVGVVTDIMKSDFSPHTEVESPSVVDAVSGLSVMDVLKAYKAHTDDLVSECVDYSATTTRKARQVGLSRDYVANLMAALSDAGGHSAEDLSRNVDAIIDALGEVHEQRNGVPSVRYIQSLLQNGGLGVDDVCTAAIEMLKKDSSYVVSDITSPVDPVERIVEREVERIVEKPVERVIDSSQTPVRRFVSGCGAAFLVSGCAQIANEVTGLLPSMPYSVLLPVGAGFVAGKWQNNAAAFFTATVACIPEVYHFFAGVPVDQYKEMLIVKGLGFLGAYMGGMLARGKSSRSDPGYELVK
ncbi:hypothetical protein HY490_01810 [Candidatus Woesearchaeota archaeon]|nr:hypothetical protein [Candidatus Woesearchaeota archaeon]